MSSTGCPYCKHCELNRLNKIKQSGGNLLLRLRYSVNDLKKFRLESWAKPLYANVNNQVILEYRNKLYFVDFNMEKPQKISDFVLNQERGPGLLATMRKTDGLIAAIDNVDPYSIGVQHVNKGRQTMVILYDTTKKRLITEQPIGNSGVSNIAFFGDNMLVGTRYGTIVVWSIAQGQLKEIFNNQSDTFIRHTGEWGGYSSQPEVKQILTLAASYPYIAVSYEYGGDAYKWVGNGLKKILNNYCLSDNVSLSISGNVIVGVSSDSFRNSISICQIVPYHSRSQNFTEELKSVGQIIQLPKKGGTPSIAIFGDTIVQVDQSVSWKDHQNDAIRFYSLRTGNMIKEQVNVNGKITDLNADTIALVNDLGIYKYSVPETEAFTAMMSFNRYRPRLPADIQRKIISEAHEGEGHIQRIPNQLYMPETFLIEAEEEAVTGNEKRGRDDENNEQPNIIDLVDDDNIEDEPGSEKKLKVDIDLVNDEPEESNEGLFY